MKPSCRQYIAIACASIGAGACSSPGGASPGATGVTDAADASPSVPDDGGSTGMLADTRGESDGTLPETTAETPPPPADAIHVALTGRDDTGDGSNSGS